MKKLMILYAFTLALLATSCEKADVLPSVKPSEDGPLTDNVILGKKLTNPYSMEIMRMACQSLFPATKSDPDLLESTVSPNVAYVRFLPADSLEFRNLMDSDMELFNYPLDYEILGDISDYHDPSLAEDQITWQYTVIPLNSSGNPELPSSYNGVYDVIELCYIPPSTSENEDELEDIAYEIAGNRPPPLYNGRPWSNPSPYTGKILVTDEDLGKTEGVKGIKVRARNFLKIRTGYTNEDGDYRINGYSDLKYTPRFELRFENNFGFKIGAGARITMPSSMDMGNSSSSTLTHDQNGRFWRAAIVNNAAYDWYKRCRTEGISKPASDLYIWVLDLGVSGGATTMLHHGLLPFTTLSQVVTFLSSYFGWQGVIVDAALTLLINVVGPDVVVSGARFMSPTSIYATTCHELAHASHFEKIGRDKAYWANVFNYELSCILSSSFQDCYGSSNTPGNGRCGVTEGLANVVEAVMRNDRYIKNEPVIPTSIQYWFLSELSRPLLDAYNQESDALSLGDMFKCLDNSITSISLYKQRLIQEHPELENFFE